MFMSLLVWQDLFSFFGVSAVVVYSLGSLKNQDDDGNKNPQICIFDNEKQYLLHASHVHISFFDVLKTFSFFLRREMTCFAVEWTT